MSEKTVPASVAMLRVLQAWDIKRVFGYPGGSFNSTMNALDLEKDRIQYVQVRHEQVGALAAAAEAKLTGKIGVAFGSAGPGAVNMLNGLYDAKEDHTPVLALVGQVPHSNMNYDFFQEFPEVPMFQDVAVYDRCVMTPESLPYVVDKAIRAAYKNRGPAVVVIPNDFGYVQIPDVNYASTALLEKQTPKQTPTDEEVDQFLKMVREAKRPVFHVGSGIKDHQDLLKKVAEKLQIPVTITGLAKGKVDDDWEGNLGTTNRAASKAADEAFATADLVIALGADFPFANLVYRTHDFKFVQIDNDESQFGRHHFLDLGIWADSGKFLEKVLERSEAGENRPFYQATVADMQDWKAYLNKLMKKADGPLSYEQIYREINRIADKDAVFGIDTGDNIINSFRFLDLKGDKQWTISALFATMGYGIPAAIAAKLAYPDRQVFSISGDGAASMVIHDLLTEVKYHLPIINIITSNQTLNFIKSEQDDIQMNHSGIDLEDADYAKIAEAMGAKGITIRTLDELPAAFDKALEYQKAGEPVVIDAKITDQRGLPVEELEFDNQAVNFTEKISAAYQATHGEKSVSDFFSDYDGAELKPLTDYFAKFGVEK
ncbi:pyruvate oxidase [Pediococcus acidilactici]|uniref:pyruvate oxidase n=1 Tax=Pediococcus acidilactici TaxID=1254 RepID=UPI00132692A9|nr:pyruvate oxidase [Pediococcus acidilactici]KAF0335621.1 pyruvate oxidase [Pediococcus acidilactici]KAF0345101.1 pyruvate oxidase [Pediococcus acidilactici]KAF0362944.1 pyruvate oxidase [Pediococcus acidilactici]KAF0384374.1 pyruvate oxidase [Pediococcus acidilactici]KAF0386750.1 pyruvate oxidase [Pediococcus acidilactici]